MQNFKNLLAFFFGLTFAALIWGVSFLFLHKTPVFYVPQTKDYSFYSINLTDIFFNTEVKKVIKKPIQTLRGVTLKAIYANGKRGFIIVEEKGKTAFVDLGKLYKGYKLTYIGENYAIFEKNGKKYKLEMKKSKIKNSFSIKTPEAKRKFTVSKKVFKEYTSNLNKIWNNIGIIKTQKGYMITYIRPNSIFTKIGLRRGDVLLEVNGRKLKNDADAWNLYKNADKFSNFEIKILRNHKEKVLNYEMD